MDADRIVALVTAAGIELTDRRRNVKGDGWSLSFASGATVEVGDDGTVRVAGKGAKAVISLLDLSIPARGT
ncbi:hypothetical protein EN828_19900 [Mesorhizobium sp. M2D.F.Ca.ET.185.01.1.1]|uniref:hypothetical protein n=1 Tax=unclassified Mesorhizobium TaxID=325217 RepID=UPI000FCA9653|nr:MULTISPECIES: hypothetical protein [unclassified Mesorhizobium]TGP78942.1 hypothetical protein EN870_15835 [bacterium M00.F.Ca.ET.227.01.1.1]TGP89529.1 hypothetical protein EN864_20510 [bacterium M00.F.Ca.ET.221.01.1.1]TGP94897.1 hypothetical protein EN865_16380 [bacterium M00.F.Ca.ET.222.01.1.1]TGT97376.1 hypothetical protein EN806_49660 [bacterium M00.F.Ca.ET.163.01.1.1]TGU28526.1 hypothetical protein EN799_37315 [bacterium M00.F.Ca.ET.156.01.1.1]TGU45886.1 hypothetical protein EN789_175